MGTAHGARRHAFFRKALGSPYFVSVFAGRYVTSGYGPWFDAHGAGFDPVVAATGSEDFIIVVMAGDGIGSIGCLPCANVSADELRAGFRAQLAAVQALRPPDYILFAAAGIGHPARAILLSEARHAARRATADWLDPANSTDMYSYAVYFPYNESLLLFTREEQMRMPWDDSHLLWPCVSGMTVQPYPGYGRSHAMVLDSRHSL